MANPPSPTTELKRKLINIAKRRLNDEDVDDVSIAKKRLIVDRLPRRIPIKIEDLDPAVLREYHNRNRGGVAAVSDTTKYYPKPSRPTRVLRREPTELDLVLKFRREHFKSDEQKSKSTDANDDLKDHVSHMISDDGCGKQCNATTMANPPSPSELKPKFTNIIDDDVSILQKAKRKSVLDRLPRRTLIKIEDVDPAVLGEYHNRGGFEAVSDPTKYYAKPKPFKPTRVKRGPSKFDAIFEKRFKSKSTDANDSKDSLSIWRL